MSKRLYSTKGAAEYLGVSVKTIKKWRQSGKLLPIETRENGYNYYSEAQLNEIKSELKNQLGNEVGNQTRELGNQLGNEVGNQTRELGNQLGNENTKTETETPKNGNSKIDNQTVNRKRKLNYDELK